jgi:ubiquinone/menaquinone biosynthesis C-methylase UbiE
MVFSQESTDFGAGKYMPTMMEIYRSHAGEYDELVAAEDYTGNLRRTLRSIGRWEGRTVVEAGIGTGRVTSLYAADAKSIVAFDRSSHMIDRARNNLASYSSKIDYRIADHLAIASSKARGDVFVEGWSFGHLIIEQSPHVRETAVALEHMIHGVVRPGGTAIIIETLGTCTAVAGPPNANLEEYYGLLEGECGYNREAIRTDYRFPSITEALRIMGFFFGEEMADRVREQGLPVVPEYTGIWWKSIAGAL